MTGVQTCALPISIREKVGQGALRAGRELDAIEICINLPIGADHPEAVANLRKAVAWHLAAPTYDWLVSHTTRGGVVARVRELWWSGNREQAADLVDDDMLLTFGLGYTRDQIRSRIEQYLAAGVTPVIDSHGIRKGHEKEDTVAIMKVAIGLPATENR